MTRARATIRSPRAGAKKLTLYSTVSTLVWQDASGQVWLSYNDPSFLAQRHGAPSCTVAETLRKALAGLAQAAVGP